MKTTKKFEEITSYQSSKFIEWFGDIDYEDKESKLYSKRLERAMTDNQIFLEYEPTELTLGEVFNYLKSKTNKEDWMIFYIKDKNGVLRAVYVRWSGGGWRVGAYSVEDPGEWSDGFRVVSRNSFDSQDLTL